MCSLIPPPPERFISYIDRHNRFILASHEKPDGDCICSSLALASFLQRRGKQVLLYNPGPFARREIRKYKQRFLRTVSPQWADGSAALLLIDCASKARVRLDDHVPVAAVAVLDHHTTPVDDAFVQYVCPRSPSSTLVVQALIEHCDAVSKREAYYLLFGFLTDSGFFRHLAENSAATLAAVGRLLTHRYSLRTFYHTLFGNREFEEVRLVGDVISQTQAFLGGRLLMVTRTKKMSDKYRVGYVSGEYVNAQLQLIKGVAVTALFTELDGDAYDVSLRALGALDVAAVAKQFGGGGHRAAAGFRWEGKLEAIQMQLIQHINTALS